MGGNLYPELVRLLREAGCEFVRSGKGSHELWYLPAYEPKGHDPEEHGKPAYCERRSQGSWIAQGILAYARRRSERSWKRRRPR